MKHNGHYRTLDVGYFLGRRVFVALMGWACWTIEACGIVMGLGRNSICMGGVEAWRLLVAGFSRMSSAMGFGLVVSSECEFLMAGGVMAGDMG